MPSLYDTHSDQSQPITTMRELRAALPIVPPNPSIWALDFESASLQVLYGMPDQHHAEVKTYTGNGVEQKTFDTFRAATECFLGLAGQVLPAAALS